MRYLATFWSDGIGHEIKVTATDEAAAERLVIRYLHEECMDYDDITVEEIHEPHQDAPVDPHVPA